VGVTRALLWLSIPRPFVVVVPGFTAVRLRVEHELRRRGWVEALTPANADLLVVCGEGGHAFAEMIDLLWEQLPSPRAFVRILSPDAVARQFDEARLALRDLAAVQADAADRGDAGAHSMRMDGMEMSAVDQSDGHAGAPNGGHDMDMGDMDMSMDMPGGIPMADRGADRDGLKLDQLHVPLGPALPDWPTGLIVRLVLQGDLVQAAEAEVAGASGGPSFWLDAEADAIGPSRVRAAAAADSLQRFLSVAGWPSAAATGRWLRDDLLASVPDATLNPRFARWLRRVRRSRVLFWSMNGLGEVGSDAPDGLRGDVSARCWRWIDELASAIDSSAATAQPAPASWGGQRAEHAKVVLSILPTLLAGQELAVARLIVASFDPDLEALQAHTLPGSHD